MFNKITEFIESLLDVFALAILASIYLLITGIVITFFAIIYVLASLLEIIDQATDKVKGKSTGGNTHVQ